MEYITEREIHKRRFGLDLVRSIAIGFVLISHFSKTLDFLGFLGVELFFGLSGFLIGHILLRSYLQTEDWSTAYIFNFWSRRWWRTLPNYYLFLVISLLVTYLTNKQLPSLHILRNFFWFGQAFVEHKSWFYGVSWSLCIEEWFYLIFPIILFFFANVGIKRKPSFITSIMIVFIGCFIARQLLVEIAFKDDLRLITIARLDAIASGVLISYVVSIYNISSKRILLFFKLGLSFIVAILTICYFLHIPFEVIRSNSFILSIVPLSGALLLPYINTLRRPINRFKLFSIGIEKVSLWSYSIYLSHMPILDSIYFLQDQCGLTYFRATIYGNLLTKMIGLFLIIFISRFIFKYFETPLTKRRPDELKTYVSVYE